MGRIFAVAHIGAGLVLALAACGPPEQVCYGDAQCPDGEYCTARGVCAAIDSGSGVDAGDATDAAAADAGGSDTGAPDLWLHDAGAVVDSAPPDHGAGDSAPRDAGGSDAPVRDAASRDAASPDTASPPDAAATDLGTHVCSDWDGIITAEELPLGPDLRAYYRNIDPDAPQPVSLIPAPTDQGPLWDFSAEVEGERSVISETYSPAGTWFAEDFPDATYTALLEDGGDVLGVFRVGADRVEMLGAVSVDEGRINLDYDPPVLLFAFPFEVGDSWLTESLVSGTFEWVYSTYFEDYLFTVTQEGRARVPAGIFPVLEVKLEHEARVYAPLPIITTQIKYSYITECYGAVATVGSRFDEEEDPFTLAREYKRLGF